MNFRCRGAEDPRVRIPPWGEEITFPGRIVPGLIVPYSTVPRQKLDSSATCHRSRSGHTDLLLFRFCALTHISALILSANSVPSPPVPPSHTTQTLSTFNMSFAFSSALPSSCGGLPRMTHFIPIQSHFQIYHTLLTRHELSEVGASELLSISLCSRCQRFPAKFCHRVW